MKSIFATLLLVASGPCLLISPARARPRLSIQDVQGAETKEALYARFRDTYRVDHRTAYETAKEYFRRYPEDAGENAQFMRRWVTAYQKVVTDGAAIPASRPGLPADKHYQLGEARVKAAEWAEAEEEFRAALLAEPENVLYRERLAYALGKGGKWPEVETHYRVLIRVKPDSATYREGLGGALYHQGKWSEAESAFKKAITLAHTDGRSASEEVSLSLADAIFRQGRLDEAETLYENILTKSVGSIRRSWNTREPAHNRLWRGLSEVHAAKNKWEEAAYDLLEAYYNDPKNEEIIGRLKEIATKGADGVASVKGTTWGGYGSEVLYSLAPDGTLNRFSCGRSAGQCTVSTTANGWEQVGRVLFLNSGAFVVKEDRLLGRGMSAPIRAIYGDDPAFVRSEDHKFDGASVGAVFLLMTGELVGAAQGFLKSISAEPYLNDSFPAYLGLGVAYANQGRWKEADDALKKAVKGCGRRGHQCVPYIKILEQVKARQRPAGLEDVCWRSYGCD